VLDIFPSGALRGEVRSASKGVPTTLELRFEGASADKSHVEGSVQCPLLGAKLAFVCYVPVGILNTRLRVHHHIGLYRFGVMVSAAKDGELGALRMEEGASISGRAELPSDIMKKPREIIVTARPSGAHESGPQMILGAMLLPQSAPLEPNGWWHIDGLTPGEYAVSAKGPGLLRSDEYLITARRNADMELMTPLVLQHPHHVTLHVTPSSLDAAPWRVTISREIVVGQAETIGQSAVSRDGHWQSQLLQPGRYVIELRSPDDESVWTTERVEISSRDEHREIIIASRHITGSVHMGEKPLEAKLRFTDASGHKALYVSSDANGKFSLDVPTEPVSWDVLVERRMPYVSHLVASVTPGEAASVDLSVPASSLSGVVEDESGNGVSALVTITSGSKKDDVRQVASSADGKFEALGLASGDYSLAAEAREGRSDLLAITLRETDPATVKLILRKSRKFRGRVISTGGVVPGAVVLVVPTDLPGSAMLGATTDANGMFAADLPQGAQEVNVFTAAPGFAFAADHIEVRDQLLTVRVEQSGGTLTLTATTDKPLILRHGSASISPSLLAAEWPATSTLNGTRITYIAPMMDPGPWSLCYADGRCATGTLDPFGGLELKLP